MPAPGFCDCSRSLLSGAALPGWDATKDTPQVSEDAVLALLDSLFPSRSEHVPEGRGDDCAELAPQEGALVISTDMFWQDTHFRAAYFTPEETGAKALASAVSDLAAAGAEPLGFSLGLLLPSGLGQHTLHRILSGMAETARECGIVLSGGDLAKSDRLGFSVTVWGGQASPGTPFLRRAQALPGDCIFLIGASGLARVGVWALEQHGRPALLQFPQACAAHLTPRPQLSAGKAVAELAANCAQSKTSSRFSLMDLSDGLVRDLPRLLGGLGAELTFDAALIPDEVMSAASRMGVSPEACFLLGGEDYSLIGSCPNGCWTTLLRAVPEANLLGKVTAAPGLVRHGNPVALKGFDHFASSESTPSGCARLPGGMTASSLSAAETAIVETGREAWLAGLMAGFNGNISCRVAASEPACLITRSGAAKSRLTPEDCSLVSLADNSLLRGSPASSESPVHLGIYRTCPDSSAILHTHPPHLLALSLALQPDERFTLPLPEAAAYSAHVCSTPFFPPGSRELADAVAKAAATHAAVWMERHGLVVHGHDLAFCLSLTEELEQLARIRLALLARR